MEKIWLREVSMQHPKKWVVMTHLEWDKEVMNKKIGVVYKVFDTHAEALEIMRSLDESYGMVSIIEGFDDTPQIGGLFG